MIIEDEFKTGTKIITPEAQAVLDVAVIWHKTGCVVPDNMSRTVAAYRDSIALHDPVSELVDYIENFTLGNYRPDSYRLLNLINAVKNMKKL
jgi:hypothetical protein